MLNRINRTTIQVEETKYQVYPKDGPLNYKKPDGTFGEIDHTFNDTSSSIGNISLMDKGIVSVGKRKGNNPHKVVGIRPDNNQHLGTQQLEFSLVNVELDGVSQSFDVETDLEIKLLPSQVSQLVKANKDFNDFKIEFDIHNTGLELQNSKYSNTTTIREDFGFNLTNLGEINTTTTNSTLGGLFTQSRATPYIECNISQITNNYITIGQYSIEEEFGSSDLSNYHIDENVYPNGGAAYLKDCIVLIAKIHNIEESIEDIFVNQMCNEYGLETIWEDNKNGQYFTKNGKKVASYYSIDNQFYMFINTKAIPDDIKTLFQRKTFNDTSFLDITLSDFNTTITNMFNVDLTIELNTDYYEPINDNFVFKVNKESFYINLPTLYDESYNKLDLGTIHSLKQNNDGSYRYTKYFSLNGYLKNTHNVKYIDADLAAGTSQNKGIQYLFPTSGTQSVNNRTSANFTTARNASTGITSQDFTTGTQISVCGSAMTIASSNGSNTFSFRIHNGTFIVFDSSGITSEVTEAEFKFRGGYRVTGTGWATDDDISIILLKGNSELGNNNTNYNDFQGHTSGWDSSDAVEYSAEYVADQTFSAGGLYGAAEAVTLNSDALSDLESLDEFQILPVEFDEWYSNSFDSGVDNTASNSRLLQMTGPQASTATSRPFIEFTAASTGFGHKTIGVASANIGKIKGVATANVGKVIGVD